MPEKPPRCSEALASYIGDIVTTSERKSEGYERYTYLCGALEELEKSGFSEDEKRQVRSLLLKKINAMRPGSTGRTSGEADSNSSEQRFSPEIGI